MRSFLSQKFEGNMIFTNYWKVLVLNFPETGNTVFFEPKSWWKDDIYWLLESSCFELWIVFVLNFSELGNTFFLWPKKLMERWYLLGLFELSNIFQDLGNMVFRAVIYRYLIHIYNIYIKYVKHTYIKYINNLYSIYIICIYIYFILYYYIYYYINIYIYILFYITYDLIKWFKVRIKLLLWNLKFHATEVIKHNVQLLVPKTK